MLSILQPQSLDLHNKKLASILWIQAQIYTKRSKHTAVSTCVVLISFLFLFFMLNHAAISNLFDPPPPPQSVSTLPCVRTLPKTTPFASSHLMHQPHSTTEIPAAHLPHTPSFGTAQTHAHTANQPTTPALLNLPSPSSFLTHHSDCFALQPPNRITLSPTCRLQVTCLSGLPNRRKPSRLTIRSVACMCEGRM